MHQGSQTEKDLHDTSHKEEEIQASDQILNEEATDEEETNDLVSDENPTPTADTDAKEEQQNTELTVDEIKKQMEELAQQNEQLQQQKEDYEHKMLRLQADFDNFRKRTRSEKMELQKYAAADFVEKLLPIVDNFNRALTSSKQSQDYESLSKGIEMIHDQLLQLLEKEEVQEIHAVGQPFNPELHQAVMQVESEEHEEGIVVEELQKGYLYKGKIIRPAMVKVSK